MKKVILVLLVLVFVTLTYAAQHDYNPSDSPAATAYNSNTYTELSWTDINVTETDVVTDVVVDYTWDTDSWASEGSFHLESPAGTSVQIASGEADGTYSHTLTDFSGETMNGTWKLWIEDSYGDGGHQATNITVSFHYAQAGAPGVVTNPNPADNATDVAINGNLTWDFGSDTSTYDLWFGPAGNMTQVVTDATAGATGSYAYSNLDYFTEYEWKVVSKNTNTRLTTEGPVWSFTTLFDGVSIGNGTNVDQHLPIEPYYGYTYSQTIYLSSDFTGVASNKRIEKIYYNYRWNGGDPDADDWVIYMGTTSQTSLTDWIPVSGLTEVYNGNLQLENLSGDGWLEITLDTPFNYDPSTDGNLIVAVDENTSGYTSSSDDFYCDQDTRANVSIYYYNDSTNPDPASPPSGTLSSYYPNTKFTFGNIPSCPEPSAQSESNITSSSADLGWTENGTATSWQIEYGTTGFTQGSGTTVNVSSNPYTLSGLSANTTYDWYVRADCSGSYSTWKGPHTFTTQVACPAPSAQNESGITASSANLGWTESGTATTWEIEYGITGFTQGSGTTVSTTNNPYNLTGLSANTTYDWYVRADCGVNGYSTWVGPSTFTTLCNAVSTFPYSYGFEDQTTGDNSSCPSDGSVSLTSCWRNISGEGSDWKPLSGSTMSGSTGPSSAQEGSIYMYCETSSSCGSVFDLYGPTFDMTSLTTPYITFYYHMYGSAVGTLQLVGSKDNGATWSDTLWALSGDQGDAWNQATVTASGYNVAQALFKWEYLNPTSYTGDVAIDNVTVEEAPSCPPPSAQSEANIQETQADLSWTENGTATSWDIELGPSGFTPTGTPTQSGVSNPYTYSGLTEATAYDWYVRSGCGSTWTGPHTFYTKKAPVVPPISQDFESSDVFTTGGWTKENSNGDAYEWTQATNNPRSGSYSMGIQYNSSLAMDDWFFTQPLSLTAGVTYVVDFWYACESATYPEKLNVYWGTNNTSSAMTNGPIFDNNNITNTDYQEGIATFTPTTTGTYYVGFHGYSDSDKYILYVDDVYIRDNNVVDNDDIEFSEVCDNKSGQNENTGFIELFNRRPYALNLGGDEIKMGDPSSFSDYTYTFPSGTTIEPMGYYVIANGANLTDFNTAWGKSLTTGQFATDGYLQITSGKAYAYNTTSKANIDETPAVGTSSRIVRNRDETWNTSTTTNDGTPGETSGGDEPLSTVLVSFMATLQAEELTLTWEVSSQNNIAHWNLYRNDVDNFGTATLVTTMDVEGSANQSQEYKFTDDYDFINDYTYYYWVESVDYSGISQILGETHITINQHDNPDAPVVVKYGIRNYPNPFNPTTTFEYAVKEAGEATLYIYNIKGQLVTKANLGMLNKDKTYTYNWNATDINGRKVGSGVYFYKLVTPKKTYTKKMMLLK